MCICCFYVILPKLAGLVHLCGICLIDSGFFSFTNWWLSLCSMSKEVGYDFLHLTPFLCWTIWKIRSTTIFESVSPYPLMVIHKTQKCFRRMAAPYSSARTLWFTKLQFCISDTSHVFLSQTPHVWQLPLRERIKANFDASFDPISYIAVELL